jgi:aquaporin Z
MKNYTAEVIGTFILVFFGCGTAVFLSPEAGEAARHVAISLAFGFALIAAAYGIGPISGAHLNPAVSLGMFLAGRMSMSDMIGYWVAQVGGGILAAITILIMTASPGDAANTAGAYGIWGALVFEVVATFLFVTVILGATQEGHSTQVAGLAIGLTLAVIHLVGINISGTSVNPARSIATNLFNTTGLAQLWIFIIAPLAGGALAGIVHQMGITKAD